MGTASLQIKFDPNQDYQLEAVDSVVRLFEGLEKQTVEFALGGETVPNLPVGEVLSERWLLDNLLAVQEKNQVPAAISPFLEVDDGPVLEGVGYESWRYPNFTVEMETGTGKTYVYLRTIYELRKHYGFSKFIVVVPSIAIYEGVIKNYQITRAHFRALYGNEPVDPVQYDSGQLSYLRSYAASNTTQIMVMTLDSFNRISNNIYKVSEKLPGERKPYQFIQETRPILILDEPQNMESARAKEALRTLHPLFALRYSATHRTSPNLIYQLTPFEAFRRNLVKKIQVYGVTERENFNEPFLALEAITTQGGIAARLRAYLYNRGVTHEGVVTIRHGEDLHGKTGREEHMGGYRVVEINAAKGFVQFDNGKQLRLNGTIGPSRREIFRVQIEKTIEQHMEAQERLERYGIKIISLFFIDRVANYVEVDGTIKKLFDEAFDRTKRRFPFFEQFAPEQVRKAYFARMKAQSGEERPQDTDSRNPAEREAERAAFRLIMQEKERLLSFDEPVCFIFAHSALKEGWDNPNVFQICTLNQTVSEIKKRQEIGRGLRLCVDQSGNRVLSDDVNVLTVIANESYRSYAATLQSEYREMGDAAPPPPTNARQQDAVRNNGIFEGSKEFRIFWDGLSRLVRYRINVDTDQLVSICIARLNARSLPRPMVVVEKGQFVVTRYVITLEEVNAGRARIAINIVNTVGEEKSLLRHFSVKDDLARLLNDERLRGYKVLSIEGTGDHAKLNFENGVELVRHVPLRFESEAGQSPQERAVLEPRTAYPVFNLLDRVARETGLTRPTINRIFKGLKEDSKKAMLGNPEGFAGVFITEITNATADHVSGRIEFVVDGEAVERDLDELFPPKKKYPQKELIEAGECGLYDMVQKDSEVEERFVERLKYDDRVVFYFKFPPNFKIHFPKMIGNYNPDWGIVRYDDAGTLTLRLIRETKGTVDIQSLQFPQEKRKILCAQKHFGALGFDYRHVTGGTLDWWMPAPRQETLDHLAY